MPITSINGTNLFYQESGKGLPVVLLHGFPLDHRIWQGQIHDLSSICRVIAPDLRGFGKSPGGGSFTMQSLAEDIYVLLEQLHALPCVLGGLSMGGYVALAYQHQYPSTLRGLMLIDTRASADTPEGKKGRDAMIELSRTSGAAAVADAMMPKMLTPGAHEMRPDVAKELRSIMESCPPETTEHALAAMRDRSDFSASLGRIVAPTLIIVGESDGVTPPAMAEEMHKSIPGSTLSLISGAGHVAPMEQPQQVGRAIKHFLRTLSS